MNTRLFNFLVILVLGIMTSVCGQEPSSQNNQEDRSETSNNDSRDNEDSDYPTTGSSLLDGLWESRDISDHRPW